MENDDLRKKLRPENYTSEKVGLATLRDIMAELAKPGRDPRDKLEAFSFAEQITSIEDVKPGMRLPGIVTNVTKFGAFVDIGVHQDGLVHISQLADRFVKDPAEVVKPQQRVMATVLDVDVARKRISLSLPRKVSPAPPRHLTRGGVKSIFVRARTFPHFPDERRICVNPFTRLRNTGLAFFAPVPAWALTYSNCQSFCPICPFAGSPRL